jgi:uncharacterized protein (DUF3084 family)
VWTPLAHVLEAAGGTHATRALMPTRLLAALLRRAAHPPHAYTTVAAADATSPAVARSLQEASRGCATELDLSGHGKPHEDLVCVNIMCERVRTAGRRCV